MSKDFIGSSGKRIIVTDDEELANIADQIIKIMVSNNLRLFEVERTIEILQKDITWQFLRNRE